MIIKIKIEKVSLIIWISAQELMTFISKFTLSRLHMAVTITINISSLF